MINLFVRRNYVSFPFDAGGIYARHNQFWYSFVFLFVCLFVLPVNGWVVLKHMRKGRMYLKSALSVWREMGKGQSVQVRAETRWQQEWVKDHDHGIHWTQLQVARDRKYFSCWLQIDTSNVYFLVNSSEKESLDVADYQKQHAATLELVLTESMCAKSISNAAVKDSVWLLWLRR